ncbi:hypothetical protein Tco_1488441 [Tanacetum coccineum]
MAEYSQKWNNETSSRSRSTETSNGLVVIQAQLKNLGREIKKVNEKVYAAQVGCEQCKGPHYTKDCPQKEEVWIREQCIGTSFTQDCPQKEEGKNLEEAFLHSLVHPIIPARTMFRATRPGILSTQTNESLHTCSKRIYEESLRHRNQGASIKTLELQIGQMSKVLQERGFGSLPSSTETNPKDQVKSISTATADSSVIRLMDHGPYAVSGPQHRLLFNQTVPFPRRLHNYCCDDSMEAHGVNILDAYNNNLPLKEKNPGSFTLPCLINNTCFNKALIDLGASVSVMPLSTYTNLGLGNLTHTRMTIEIADRTIKLPKGIATDVLVRIGKFIFPVDFVILDIPEDDDVPLILGRPFLSTAHAKIDVFKRKITLRVGEEKMVFESFKPTYSMIKRVFME